VVPCRCRRCQRRSEAGSAGNGELRSFIGKTCTKEQSRNRFPISVALFDPKPQAMVF